MATDILIDPSTRDYVPTAAGDWTETNDSRTAVILQLSCEYNRWGLDPSSGSRINEMLRSGDPIQPDQLRAECARAMGELVKEGLIADVVITINAYDSARGAVEIGLTWWDRASNSPVDLVYTPMGGVPR